MARPRMLLVVASIALASQVGCKSDGTGDPFRPMNRVFFGLNMGVERYIASPISEQYTTIVARPIRKGVSNFFSNLAYAPTILYDFLQGRFGQVLGDLGRITINSTVGIVGFLDIASKVGLPAHEQNFGVTAAAWGLPAGPYLVLPLLGPTTVTGLPDIPVRILLSPITYLDPATVRVAAGGGRAVNKASTRQDNIRRVREAVDPYEYVHSAYLQKQEDLIRRWKNKKDQNDAYPFEDLPEDLDEPTPQPDSPTPEPDAPHPDTPAQTPSHPPPSLP